MKYVAKEDILPFEVHGALHRNIFL